jgi:hypothetical protein
MSAYLYEVCSTVWSLLYYMINAYLYDICFTARCLPARIVSAYLYDNFLPKWLNDVCVTVWCFLNCMMSVHLFLTICLLTWCLPTCNMFAFLYSVESAVWCLPTCMKSIWRLVSCPSCLPIYILFARLYNVCLPVWSRGPFLCLASSLNNCPNDTVSIMSTCFRFTFVNFYFISKIRIKLWSSLDPIDLLREKYFTPRRNFYTILTRKYDTCKMKTENKCEKNLFIPLVLEFESLSNMHERFFQKKSESHHSVVTLLVRLW